MDKIHWWLLKFKESYQLLDEKEQSRYVAELEDGSVARLPPFQTPNEKQVFLCIYEALDTISDFHRNEEYYQRELVRYKSISKADTLSLKKWVADNEKLGAEDYDCFLLDYLDYSDTPKHLSIFFLYAKDLNFYVNRKNFKYTLIFLEIFQDLYWNQDILQRFA
ncbi:hypothetical protein [Salinimicrobium sp. GXAS 041]|uniref:hypothetical protein n=1 Tax=Salinimicrobium sp. GXAS 041 TaxID=3400806 RepID=UPI003C737E69